MIAIILENWKKLSVLALMAAFGIIFALYRHEAAALLTSQQNLNDAHEAIHQLEKNAAITERTNNAYQNDLSSLRADIVRMRQRPAVCVGVATAPVVPDGSGQGAAHDGKNEQGAGLHSEWLQDYAIEAERYRIERNACFYFLNQMYNGQKK